MKMRRLGITEIKRNETGSSLELGVARRRYMCKCEESIELGVEREWMKNGYLDGCECGVDEGWVS